MSIVRSIIDFGIELHPFCNVVTGWRCVVSLTLEPQDAPNGIQLTNDPWRTPTPGVPLFLANSPEAVKWLQSTVPGQEVSSLSGFIPWNNEAREITQRELPGWEIRLLGGGQPHE